jgi:phosphate-selective porin OprO and OprP
MLCAALHAVPGHAGACPSRASELRSQPTAIHAHLPPAFLTARERCFHSTSGKLCMIFVVWNVYDVAGLLVGNLRRDTRHIMTRQSRIMKTLTAKTTLCMLVLGVAVLAWPIALQAQDLTEREKAMLERIEALEKRIVALESKAEGPAPKIEEGVENLEKSVAQEAEASENDLRAYWKGGLRLETANKDFQVRLGGRLQNDFAWFDDDDSLRFFFGDQEDGAEFRRSRLYVRGTLYGDFSFKIQYDFAGGDADFKDVWLAANNLPYLGTLKVGHFDEPFSLNEITSDNTITFMERALPTVFVPGRNMGVALSNTAFNQRMAWTVGLFRTSDDYGMDRSDGGYSLTARVTGLPWYEKEGRRLLHLGTAYSHRNVDGPLRYRQRPEAHLSSVRFLDTGAFQAEDVDLYNAELALVYGSLSLQGEYFLSEVDTAMAGRERFDGYYAFASVFLTGEHRPYDKFGGVFGKVNPKRNFTLRKGGAGAWEVAARYSQLDLGDDFFLGGEERNWTLGLNWYLNPQIRLMLNYGIADIDHVFYEGDIETLQMRVQTVF